MKSKKFKKAMIDKVALSMVIAVLCLVLIFVFGSKLYQVFNQNNKIEQAKGKLDEISRKISYMESNEKIIKDFDIILTAPKNWYLIYFEDLKELCICEELRTNDKEQKEICKDISGKKGICKKFQEEIVIDNFEPLSVGGMIERRNAIKIELTNLGISKEERVYHLAKSKKEIELSSNLREFLDSEIDISNVHEKLKKEGIKEGDKIKDLLVLRCFTDNLDITRNFQNTFEYHFKNFFEDKIKQEEFIKIGFNNQFSSSVPYWEEDSGLQERHELKIYYPSEKSDYKSRTYEIVQNSAEENCLIYFYSTESNS